MSRLGPIPFTTTIVEKRNERCVLSTKWEYLNTTTMVSSRRVKPGPCGLKQQGAVASTRRGEEESGDMFARFPPNKYGT